MSSRKGFFLVLIVAVCSVALGRVHALPPHPQTLYLLCLSKEVIARVLDVLFLEGSNILVSVGLAFFVAHEKELLRHDDLMSLLGYISKLGEGFTDNDELMRMVLKESRCRIGEEDERRRVTERRVMEDAYTKDLQTTQSVRGSGTRWSLCEWHASRRFFLLLLLLLFLSFFFLCASPIP